MIGEQQGIQKLFRHQTVDALHDCHIYFFLLSTIGNLDENAGFQSLINNALFFHSCDM
jgi:hypothetical protein